MRFDGKISRRKSAGENPQRVNRIQIYDFGIRIFPVRAASATGITDERAPSLTVFFSCVAFVRVVFFAHTQFTNQNDDEPP